MSTKYFFIDDEANSEVNIALLQNKPELEITFHLKEEWKEQVDFIIKENFDGLLLDWQLQKDTINDYDAEALANQIRRLISEGKIKKDFPIILCSAAKDFKILFNKDETGHKAFDYVYAKDDFSIDVLSKRNKFIALSNGYKTLRSSNDAKEILSLKDNFSLDKRVLTSLQNEIDKNIPHEVAHFLIYQVLEPPSILINEELLAVRLGIDKIKSIENWNFLLESLKDFKYSGIFSIGWDRWWMSLVEQWWSDTFENSLRRLNANERVEVLSTFFKREFIALKKHEKHTSENFWTICVSKKHPIDPIDGLLIDKQDNLYPWQEKQYLSIDAVTDSKHEPVYKINPLEQYRLDFLKSHYHARKRTRR